MIYTANSVLQIALHPSEIILNTNQKLCKNFSNIFTSLLRPKSQKNILKVYITAYYQTSFFLNETKSTFLFSYLIFY